MLHSILLLSDKLIEPSSFGFYLNLLPGDRGLNRCDHKVYYAASAWRS